VTFSVPPQEILTKDSVTVAVDAVVFYRVKGGFMDQVDDQSHYGHALVIQDPSRLPSPASTPSTPTGLAKGACLRGVPTH
jgi:erythrocyte band 7 integral membrane protein